MPDKPTLSELAGNPLFATLSEDELRTLLDISTYDEFEAGQTIFSLGQDATTLYLVAQGTVQLTLPLKIRDTQSDVVIDEKEQGAVVAWSALIAPHKLTLDARAATRVRMLGFPRQALEPIFAQHQRLHLVLISNIAGVIASRLALMEGLLLRDLQRFVAEKYS